MQVLAAIPSPTRSVWHLGPLPIRAYAVCIIIGILVAVWLTKRRWRERGGDPDHVWDVAAWAIVLGIIGGRLYHVVTDPELYFGAGRNPVNAFKIWDGGLGIWGAIALGTLGRLDRLPASAHQARRCSPTPPSPGVVFAQGIGRLGNWFNNELYGGPTSLPWKLQIHCLDIDVGHATGCNGVGTQHRARLLPADVPLRDALGHRRRRGADSAGPAAAPRPRQRDGALRHGLHRRAGLDRGAAQRSRQPLPRACGSTTGPA